MKIIEINELRRKRLQDAVDRLDNGNVSAFGRRLGYRDGAFIRQMLSGSRKVTENTVRAIEAIPGMGYWFDPLSTLAKEHYAEQSSVNVRPAPIGARRVPLISYVQAGRMSEAVDPFPPGAAFEYLLTDLELSEHAFALEIEGLSMAPEFNPGDRIIVDPAITQRPGDFVVAKNGHEEATFKRYRVRGINAAGEEVFELVPLNPDYPTINSEIQPVKIIAVMVEHRRYRKK
ncbi:putative HTH-type transcriptional regulator [Burkholderia glumae]|uniref:LexA family protein n=1 Tax=Burkholderia glumae TaxID=337 RepID=UPI001BB5D9BA|nr:S24 family peptidase [Burkholderia glumae]QTP33506.1 putative HTH-type transcriptional regulator [Burkholderia glumae]